MKTADAARPGKLPPSILVDPQLAAALWNHPERHPNMRVAKPSEGHGADAHPQGQYGCTAPEGVVCVQNWVITVTTPGEDEQVFIIRGWHPEAKAWVASWPD